MIAIRLTLFALLAALSLRPSPADAEPVETSIEGLQLVERDRHGEIYAADGIDWTEYTAIRLERATVAFRKNWQRDKNRNSSHRVRDKDVENIKSRLADLFDEVFSETLTDKGDYLLTDTDGDNVMVLEPHIVDLDIAAPDTPSPGITRSYVDSAGRMTLILQIYDSQSGALIAKASNRQEATHYTYARWANSVSNTAEARKMLRRWADELVKRLDDARAQTTGSG